MAALRGNTDYASNERILPASSAMTSATARRDPRFRHGPGKGGEGGGGGGGGGNTGLNWRAPSQHRTSFRFRAGCSAPFLPAGSSAPGRSCVPVASPARSRTFRRHTGGSLHRTAPSSRYSRAKSSAPIRATWGRLRAERKIDPMLLWRRAPANTAPLHHAPTPPVPYFVPTLPATLRAITTVFPPRSATDPSAIAADFPGHGVPTSQTGCAHASMSRHGTPIRGDDVIAGRRGGSAPRRGGQRAPKNHAAVVDYTVGPAPGSERIGSAWVLRDIMPARSSAHHHITPTQRLSFAATIAHQKFAAIPSKTRRAIAPGTRWLLGLIDRAHR